MDFIVELYSEAPVSILTQCNFNWLNVKLPYLDVNIEVLDLRSHIREARQFKAKFPHKRSCRNGQI